MLESPRLPQHLHLQVLSLCRFIATTGVWLEGHEVDKTVGEKEVQVN